VVRPRRKDEPEGGLHLAPLRQRIESVYWSAPLRSRIVWLRNVRYFVHYYPPTGFVSSVSLLSASGQLLYRVSGSDGEFF